MGQQFTFIPTMSILHIHTSVFHMTVTVYNSLNNLHYRMYFGCYITCHVSVPRKTQRNQTQLSLDATKFEIGLRHVSV